MRTTSRRGSILLVTFMAITIAAMIATGLLLRADASQDVVGVSRTRMQARALAWSGVQAATAQLWSRRSELLSGADPEVFEEFEISLGSSRGIARTLQLAEDVRVECEPAKLPLNRVDVVSLAKLPGMGEAFAKQVVGKRVDGFYSPESALAQSSRPSDSDRPEESDATSLGEAGIARPVRMCSVFAFDPEIAGAAAAAVWPDMDGEARWFVGDGWTVELAEAVAAWGSEEDVKRAEACFKSEPRIESASGLVVRLAGAGVPREQWGAWLDVFTPNPDRFRAGVIDINRAPAAVLACIPGISAEAAERLVSLRPTLDAVTRASVTWPLLHGPLTQDQFELAVDWFTTRSLQFRVRIEAGTAASESLDATAEADSPPPLAGRVVLEAVIDIAGERPRIAYLRDVTLEPWQTAMPTPESETDLARESEVGSDGNEIEEPVGGDGPGASDDSENPPPAGGLEIDGLNMDDAVETEPDLSLGDLELGSKDQEGREKESARSSGVAGPDGQESTSDRGRPTDNRIGRWTFRRGRP